MTARPKLSLKTPPLKEESKPEPVKNPSRDGLLFAALVERYGEQDATRLLSEYQIVSTAASTLPPRKLPRHEAKRKRILDILSLEHGADEAIRLWLVYKEVSLVAGTLPPRPHKLEAFKEEMRKQKKRRKARKLRANQKRREFEAQAL